MKFSSVITGILTGVVTLSCLYAANAAQVKKPAVGTTQPKKTQKIPVRKPVVNRLSNSSKEPGMDSTDVQFQPFLDWSNIQAGRIDFVEQDGHKVPRRSFVPSGIKIVPQTAELSEVWFKSEKAWEADRINGYSTVIFENGKYRLWYESLGDNYPKNGSFEYGYAESTDGITWTRPNLGLIDYNGSKENNISYHHAPGTESGTVFVDPTAPASERYKRLFIVPEDGHYNTRGAVSADGISWKNLPEPILTDFFSDTQVTAYYDEIIQSYVGYFRGHKYGRRSIARSVTKDFNHWPRPEVVLYPGINESPGCDFYTNAHVLYPGKKNLHLLFPAQYNRDSDIVDIHIATSTNGINWEYFSSKPVVSVKGTPYHTLYCGDGVVPLGNDTYGVPCCGFKATHNDYTPLQHEGEYFWAMWKKDRFIGIEAEGTGYFATDSFTHSASALHVNVDTEYAGMVKVQLSDGAAAIPGYSFADCDPIMGDNIDKVVSWKGSTDITATRGKSVVVEFSMQQAKVFAYGVK